MYVPSRAALKRCVSDGPLPAVIEHCWGCALLVAGLLKLSQAVDMRDSKRIVSSSSTKVQCDSPFTKELSLLCNGRTYGGLSAPCVVTASLDRCLCGLCGAVL
eukprot:20087-Heterococcus_DN1.PRE.5